MKIQAFFYVWNKKCRKNVAFTQNLPHWLPIISPVNPLEIHYIDKAP